MSVTERVSLVIPAYNEESRIDAVLKAAVDSPSLDEIIVVDDGSIDATARIASSFDAVLLRHMTNRGKGEAMHTGYIFAKEIGSTTLAFLDADLKGLVPENINSLVTPVVEHRASMTIGILERTDLQKAFLKRWGAFSGQRVLPIETWEGLTKRDRHGFNVEAALNARARQNGTHRDIERIELNGVTHTGQREKQSNLSDAAATYTRIYGSALATYLRIDLEGIIAKTKKGQA